MLSLIGLGLNQVFMWFFVEITVLHYIIAKVLATILVMAWNFISRKIWLEK
ncbi:MAG: GtrA family protein [Aerococcus urinaeequi]